MYWIEDKTAAIKNAQRLLGVNQTGFYNSATKNEVKKIQALNSYKETGEIDYETFLMIVNEYNRKSRTVNKACVFHSNLPFKLNDINEDVLTVHTVLKAVLRDYAYEEIIPEGPFLGVNTLKAVNFLRTVFDMPLSDEIDEEFISRLLLEKESIELKHRYG